MTEEQGEKWKRKSAYIPQELGQEQRCPFCGTMGYLVQGKVFKFDLFCPKCSPEALQQERDAYRIRCAGLTYPNAKEIRGAMGVQ